ncbi:MAG: SAM-dependent methyltransferase [Hyphomicrobiales bacterium]
MATGPHAPPSVFDEALVAERLARSDPSVDFLDRHAAREAVDRIALANRTFATVGVLARRPAAVRNILAAGLPGTTVVEAPAGPVACLVVIFGPETINDLPVFLERCRAQLQPDGLFLCAMLAGDTLSELREAFTLAELERTGGASPRVAAFAGIRDLGGLLQRAGFAMPVVDSERLTVRYGEALSLMRELKAMGWSNPVAARSRTPATRGLLAEAARTYADRFADPDGRVRATFEIAWLTGWSPGPGQPVPLRPGSAKVRLAEALKTTERKL